MIFSFKKHDTILYNTLLGLSRNLFFYNQVKLNDNFETRIILMFFHFSILMFIYKRRGKKFDQKSYDSFFHNIENNLRELGFGDVSVNKKMKDLNNILYDILLKINSSGENSEFSINKRTILKYFNQKDQKKDLKYEDIETYFNDFFNFCFELSLDNMIKDLKKYKFNNGCT
jgi:cytochrome b pre-mRNA-processing protein 3